QLVGAVPRTENIRLQIAAELRIAEWRSGSFRLAGGGFTPEHAQVLPLESALHQEGMASVRPSARFRSGGAEFGVRRVTERGIATDQSSLTSRTIVDVQRGALTQLAFQLPPGWNVDQVDPPSEDLNFHWTVSPGPKPRLLVDFQRPVSPGVEVEVRVRLRQTG